MVDPTLSKSITVMVKVAPDDILDVLAWHEGAEYGWDREPNPENSEWLESMDVPSDMTKAVLVQSMPPSLGWCVNELLHHGVTPLWHALAMAGVTDPRLVDQIEAKKLTRCDTYRCDLAVEDHDIPDELGQIWHHDRVNGVRWPTESALEPAGG